MRYILATTEDMIVQPVRFAELDKAPDIAHKGWRWLPCAPVPRPAFDPAAETVEGPSYVVGAGTVTETWTKRALAAQELDARKEARLDAEDRLQFEVHFDLENRVRALEGRAAVTRAQYRAALKARL